MRYYLDYGDMEMKYVLAFGVAGVMFGIGTVFLEQHLHKISFLQAAKSFKLRAQNLIILMAFIIFSVLLGVFFGDEERMSMLKSLVLIYTLFFVSLIDMKERIIPNKSLVFLCVVRTMIMVFECFALGVKDFFTLVLLPSLAGALAGGGILLLIMVISRKGLGAGDVKLFAVIGFFAGSAATVLSCLFCTALLLVLFSLCGMILKKIKAKDLFPMAPFVLSGVVLQTFFDHWRHVF
jgi:leader peptidase (prepilin peptidase)/N-methyltransferase